MTSNGIAQESTVNSRGDGRRTTSVVLFTNSFQMGGMEAHLALLAKGLTAQGVRVAVISPDDETIAPLRDQLRSDGVDVHALPSNRRGAAAMLQRLQTMSGLIRCYRPAIVHIHNTGSDGGALPMLAAKIAGASAIVRTEHQPPDHPVTRRQRMLIHLRDRWLDRIICVSRANLEQHVNDLRRDRRKFTSIPNCLDLSAFDPQTMNRDTVRALIGAHRESVVVGTVGRLVEPRKGVEFFVDMARILAAERQDYKFFVSGEGSRRTELERRAEGNALFIGRYPRAAEAYAAMDVFVMPALWEGGPITVLEAMAMERAVVSTDVGMVREVIQDGVNGRIVPPGDAAALAAAVRELALDADLRQALGRRARATIEAGYGQHEMLSRTLRVYTDLDPGVSH